MRWRGRCSREGVPTGSRTGEAAVCCGGCTAEQCVPPACSQLHRLTHPHTTTPFQPAQDAGAGAAALRAAAGARAGHGAPGVGRGVWAGGLHTAVAIRCNPAELKGISGCEARSAFHPFKLSPLLHPGFQLPRLYP